MPPALRSTIPYLLVALLALLAGLPALRAGFVFDDTAQVLQNPAVRELDLGKIFGRGYWANASEAAESFDAGAELYRPLTTLSIASSYQLYGAQPLGYRVENLALHALASALALALLLAWGFAQRTACFAAALFAVLPIHAEVLGSIILRNELLAACAGAVALAAHARGRWLCAAVVMFAALLAKESAIALPVLAWLADRAGLRREPLERGAAWRAYGGLIGACAVALLLRVAVIGQLGLGDPKNLYFHEESGVAVWLTMARYATVHYLGATALGWPLVFDFSPRSFATSSSGDMIAWALLLAWAALSLTAILALWKRRSRAAFAFLFFVVALGPTANLLTRVGILGANRLAYFPSFGLALLLALLGEALLRRARGREKPLLVAAAVLVLGYGVRTASALGAFAHPYTLYSSVLVHAPENALALGSRGLTCFQIGVGAEAPPAAEISLPREQWLARSFEDLRQSLVVDPSRWRAALPNLVYAAFHTESARELAPLLDSCLRRKEPGLAAILPPLDGTPASLARWATALQGFAARGSRERALTAVARVLGPWAELDAFDPRSADAAARAAQAERIAALRQLVRALAQDGDRFTAALAQSALAPAFDRASARWAR
jgi:hypothetical protein